MHLSGRATGLVVNVILDSGEVGISRVDKLRKASGNMTRQNPFHSDIDPVYTNPVWMCSLQMHGPPWLLLVSGFIK